MALPKLETPKYRLVVPSTKQEIEYRPFLVKEEKILMMANESDDAKQYVQSLKDIIIACTFNKLKVNDLTTYDLEYIFLQLRCKSVGESVTLVGSCPANCPNGEECKHKTEIKVDLSKVEVQEPKVKPNDMVKVNDDVSIKLKPITVKNMNNIRGDDFTSTIIHMIDSVYDTNEIYDIKDSTYEEVEEFVDSFPHSVLEEIKEFVVNQPKMTHTVKYNCSKCNLENEIVIDGFQDFFV